MNRAAIAKDSNSENFSPHSSGILQRKCASCSSKTTAEGECVQCANKNSKLQRKLSIGSSNDPLEHEADRVAEQVMSMSPNSSIATTGPKIQRASTSTGGSDASVPSSVDRVLAGPGTQMQPALRQDMEQRFGHDFSQVRVHTGSSAEQSAHDVNALAYTVGQHMVFATGQYNSHSGTGRTLLAHELTHTIQQNTDLRLQRSCGPDSIGSVGGCIGVGGQNISDVGMSSNDIYRFDVNCDDFQAGEASRLSGLAASLLSGDTVDIHGFSSEEGDPVFNENLSCARTQAAANILAGTVPLTLFKHGATLGPRDDRRSVVVEVSRNVLLKDESNTRYSTGDNYGLELADTTGLFARSTADPIVPASRFSKSNSRYNDYTWRYMNADTPSERPEYGNDCAAYSRSLTMTASGHTGVPTNLGGSSSMTVTRALMSPSTAPVPGQAYFIEPVTRSGRIAPVNVPVNRPWNNTDVVNKGGTNFHSATVVATDGGDVITSEVNAAFPTQTVPWFNVYRGASGFFNTFEVEYATVDGAGNRHSPRLYSYSAR